MFLNYFHQCNISPYLLFLCCTASHSQCIQFSILRRLYKIWLMQWYLCVLYKHWQLKVLWLGFNSPKKNIYQIEKAILRLLLVTSPPTSWLTSSWQWLRGETANTWCQPCLLSVPPKHNIEDTTVLFSTKFWLDLRIVSDIGSHYQSAGLGNTTIRLGVLPGLEFCW